MSASNGHVKHSGVAFEHGDAVIIIPPLTVALTQGLAKDIDLAQEPLAYTEEERQALLSDRAHYVQYRTAMRDREAAMTRVVRAALKRNYPDITDDEIGEFITEGNLGEAFQAAMGLSKAPKVKSPEGQAPVSAGPTSSGTASTGA